MLVFGDFGIMLRCTLGGVCGNCNGDRIWWRVLGTSGASCGGRDATRLGGAHSDGSSNFGSNVSCLSFVGLSSQISTSLLGLSFVGL
jgi:hypothetical protein